MSASRSDREILKDWPVDKVSKLNGDFARKRKSGTMAKLLQELPDEIYYPIVGDTDLASMKTYRVREYGNRMFMRLQEMRTKITTLDQLKDITSSAADSSATSASEDKWKSVPKEKREAFRSLYLARCPSRLEALNSLKLRKVTEFDVARSPQGQIVDIKVMVNKEDGTFSHYALKLTDQKDGGKYPVVIPPELSVKLKAKDSIRIGRVLKIESAELVNFGTPMVVVQACDVWDFPQLTQYSAHSKRFHFTVGVKEQERTQNSGPMLVTLVQFAPSWAESYFSKYDRNEFCMSIVWRCFFDKDVILFTYYPVRGALFGIDNEMTVAKFKMQKPMERARWMETFVGEKFQIFVDWRKYHSKSCLPRVYTAGSFVGGTPKWRYKLTGVSRAYLQH